MNKNDPPVRIAIDGPAASGKSTTARLVAQALGFLYVDTGAMYRAVTLAVLEKNIDPGDGEAISRLAKDLNINLVLKDHETRTHMNGRDVSDEIRLPAVTAVISRISSHPGLRRIMVEKQRQLAAKGNVVMEGRDIGTVVIPDAEIKIFMQASLDERAQRRLEELKAKGVEISLAQIRTDIRRRDDSDASRSDSPLKAAADAVVLDTSRLTIVEQVDVVLRLFRSRFSAEK
jgi:cytidylate kinase